MKTKPLSPELDTIDLHPDAWERTERLVKASVAQSRRTAPADKPPPRSGIVVKGK